MQVSFAASFPKSEDYPEANEDCFVITEDNLRIALCDGATESFDSKVWAQCLAHRFADDPVVNPCWMQEAVNSYQSRYDLNALSWAQQAAFERGSFATLLGIETAINRELVNIFAVGDSIALLIEGRTLVQSWPYSSSDQFSQRPLLLSTIARLNDFVMESDFNSKTFVQWPINNPSDTALLCMTDALGLWVLRMIHDQDSTWEQLLTLETEADLGTLVLAERNSRRMRTDDSTLIVVRFD